MSRPNVQRMRRHQRRADFTRWDAELRAAGAEPWTAREIVRDMEGKCRTWDLLRMVMPQVVTSAQSNGVWNQ